MLFDELKRREEQGNPLRVAMIGAGKFGGMFLAQARTTPGMHVAVIADRVPQRARDTLTRVGWPAEILCNDISSALKQRKILVTDDVDVIFATEEIDVVIEATGHVAAAVTHAEKGIAAGKHMVMVTVEADALIGPALADKARAAGLVYTYAYGDQPALICEMVDWARSSGFEVVCAGKGTKYLPDYHTSTPQTVWGYYGFSEEQVAGGDFNAQMFNSFLDGTKSSIEMAALANATGLLPQSEGLQFPPAATDELAQVCRPREAGGVLTRSGTVEVVSSLRRDGTQIEQDLRWGVYVTFRADHEYVRRCFQEYGVVKGDGEYAALFRPVHFIGLELGISVARAGLLKESIGAPRSWLGDVAAVAKRDLKPGDVLDGEGGATVWGRLVPVAESLRQRVLPIGLAQDIALVRPVPAGQMVTHDDVAPPAASRVWEIRRQLEHGYR